VKLWSFKPIKPIQTIKPKNVPIHLIFLIPRRACSKTSKHDENYRVKMRIIGLKILWLVLKFSGPKILESFGY
jgi:hypothetical protein